MSLDLIYPQGIEVKVGETTLTIKKFTLVQLPTAMRLSRPIINAFFASGFLALKEEQVSVASDWPFVIMDLLDTNGEYMVEFVRFVAGKAADTPENIDFINSLDIDAALRIIQAAVKVNWDFIKARILPIIEVKVKSQTGSTQSTLSSQQDMQEATSTITP